MPCLFLFAGAFLFWSMVATCLTRAEMVAVSVRRVSVAPFHSRPIRGTALLPANTVDPIYN